MSEVKEEECSILRTINLIGKKWIVYIICELLVSNELSFSDLQSKLEGKYGEKISGRVLTDALTILEEEAILNREVVSEHPMRVQYSLTQKGYDLEVALGAVKAWGIKYGGLRHKKCKSFSCIHNAVSTIDLDKAKEILYNYELP